MGERWVDPNRLRVAPTLSDDELRDRASPKNDDDTEVVVELKRYRANPKYESVSQATIYGRRHRAKMKAARSSA